jgi:hypothetical protein
MLMTARLNLAPNAARQLSFPDETIGFQLSGASFDGSGEHRRVGPGGLVPRGAGERLIRFRVNHLDR